MRNNYVRRWPAERESERERERERESEGGGDESISLAKRH